MALAQSRCPITMPNHGARQRKQASDVSTAARLCFASRKDRVAFVDQDRLVLVIKVGFFAFVGTIQIED